jgi:MFS family permease
MSTPAPEMTIDTRPWYRQLTAYHWFVFFVASLAWFFDCLDQRLFSLARITAVTALSEAGTSQAQIQDLGKIVTAVFLVGWGIGGLVFGAMGDRYGRARMLTVTVLIYSVCTGMNFFSQSVTDFAIFRFLTGLGVGGVFGLAVSLIAETVPNGARTAALGMLQILSTVGNVSAGFVKQGIDALEYRDFIAEGEGWRWVFLVGAAPALLVVVIQAFLKEPESWLRAKEEGRLPKGAIFAPYANLLKERHLRKNLAVGATIASAGVIGLWAIGEYAVDIQNIVFKNYYTEQGLSGDALTLAVNSAKNTAFTLQMLGGAVGMWLLAKAAAAYGRRPAFAIGFSLAFVVTALSYWLMNSPTEAYILMPLMGATQLSLFAGFAIYLPELFPARLRSTGTGFCYNLGRFAAAAGSFFSAWIATQMFGAFPSPLRERYAAITMCAIFLVGLAALPFAPETKDKPLPE